MINRNDMLELTRRMTLSRNCFMRAAGAYIDEDGFIDDYNSSVYYENSSYIFECYIENKML